MRRGFCFAMALLALASPLLAQATDPQPTLEQTVTWIQTVAPTLLFGLQAQFDRRYSIRSSLQTDYSDVTVSKCVMSWATHSTISVQTTGKPADVQESATRFLLPLKDVDVNGVALRSDTLLSDDPQDMVVITTRPGIGPTIRYQSNTDATPKTDSHAVLYVRTPDAGARVVNALKRAAVLCGAPVSPF